MKNAITLDLIIILFFVSVSTAFCQIGNVGINTVEPKAMLHVKDSCVLFEGYPQPSGQNPMPVNGAGNRMMWIPDRVAFRVGGVNGEQWHRDSIGYYSFAAGHDVSAPGYYSVACGNSSRSIGTFSVAMGYKNSSRAFFTTAIGRENTSIGENSSSIGDRNTAKGVSSMAMGSNAISNGDYSIALGHHVRANGFAGTVLGLFNDSIVAPQTSITSTTPLFIVGNGVDVSQRSNAMVVRYDGRVGLGINSPSSRLHVHSPTSGEIARFSSAGTEVSEIVVNNAYSILGYGAEYDYGYSGTKTSGPFFLRSNNLNRMVISPSGNIGIGNFSPTYKLDVLVPESASQIANFRSESNTGWINIGNANDIFQVGMNSASSFLNAPSTKDLSLNMNGETQFIIKGLTKRIGIGTNTPATTFHVHHIYGGEISRFTTSNSTIDVSVASPSVTTGIGCNYFGGIMGTKTDSDFFLMTNGIQRMIIHKNGNVGIGQNSPQSKFTVYTTEPNSIISRFVGTVGFSEINVSNLNGIMDFGTIDGRGYLGTKSNGDLQIRTNALARIYITQEGSVGIGTSTPVALLDVNGIAVKPGGGFWAASSDQRLKQNIQPYTDGLDKVLNIRPVSYQYNERSGFDTEPTYIGVIAQELKEVAPYMVTTTENVTADGGAGYLQVDNSAMVFMLINAVKEQQEVIQALEKRVAQLEGR